MATIYYRVKARNAAGDSAASNTDTVLVTELPGGAPTNPLATPVLSPVGISLSWGNVTDATKYKLYRSTTPGFTPGAGNKLASEPSSSPFTDTTSLSSNTLYYYRIRAANADNYDAPNYSVQFTGATHVTVPQTFAAQRDYNSCPVDPETQGHTYHYDLTWSNANVNGNVRSETMVIQKYDGTWTDLISSVTAGSTSYSTGDVGASVTQFRIRYLSEGTYATSGLVDNDLCPV